MEDLFELLKVTNALSKEQLTDKGYPVYSSDTANSGIIGRYKTPEFIIEGDNRLVVFGDHTRTFNIASKSFSVLDNVKVLKPKYNSEKVLLFMCTAWKKAIPNLGYARHWKIAKDKKIKLPVTPSGTPDFKFMERYITALEKTVIKNAVMYKDRVIEETKKVIGE